MLWIHPAKNMTNDAIMILLVYIFALLVKTNYFQIKIFDNPMQAMRFGDLPPWIIELSDSVREGILLSYPALDPLDMGSKQRRNEIYPFPSNLLWREPLFDQLIVNVYHPGEVRNGYYLTVPI